MLFWAMLTASFFLPRLNSYFLRVDEITSMLAKMLADLSDHQYVSSGEEFLCSIDQNYLLRQERTLSDYGIVNGEHLMLC